ncbi:MAG: SMC family ATPase [Candidatus Thermoplasmatota archaeon]|nr:SMC family ATPase [Candidatus Thermoplasmatota archaeon]
MKTLESFSKEAPKERVTASKKPPPSPHDGFVLQAVEMKGFMRYLERTSPPITFPGKFTAVTGPTGAGKTTILDAITFALYKRSTRTDIRGIRISEICRNGGYVTLIFHQGGSVYEVKRGFSSTGSPYLELRRDGKNIRGTIPELEAVIEDIIGLDYDGFRNSTFVRQEEMKQLGADRPSERLEVFQKLFRLETFEKAADIAKERLDAVRAEMQAAEGELLVLREQLSQLSRLREEVESWEGRVVRYGGAHEVAESQLSSRQEELKELEKGHEAQIEAKTTLEALRSSREDLEQRLQDKREVLRRLPELKERAEKLSKEVRELEGLGEETQDLMARQQRVALLRKELESVEDRMRDAEASFKALVASMERKIQGEETRLAGLSTDIGVEEAFQVLKQEGSLEERVTRIRKELRWLSHKVDLVEMLRKEQGETQKALTATKKKVRGINRDTFLYSEIGDRIATMRRELDERREEWEGKREELGRKRQELRGTIEKAGYGPEEKKRLSALREALERLREKMKPLQRAREELQRLEDLEDLIGEMETQRSEILDRMREASQLLSKAEKSEEAYEKARKDVELLRERRDEATKTLYEAEASLKAAQQQLHDLQQLETRLKDAESRLKEHRAVAEVHAILREGVFHKKGVVMYAINRLLPELEIETSKNLNDLTNGRLQRVKLETHEETRGYGIRILVEGVDKEWHDVGVFSGGERTQINAALRFAIAKELASMPQVGRTYGRMKTLFIDEGDLGSLDTESSRELFVSTLFKMGESFEKVILITHLAEVAEKFPGRIRVTMTATGESKAEVLA